MSKKAKKDWCVHKDCPVNPSHEAANHPRCIWTKMGGYPIPAKRPTPSEEKI